jgi:DNA-binding NarL/FixJ family response regulator
MLRRDVHDPAERQPGPGPQRCRHPVPRQNELLRLLAAGHTNSQIARRLGISEGTVRTHLENIYDKLGVSSRTAAVARAFPDRVA